MIHKELEQMVQTASTAAGMIDRLPTLEEFLEAAKQGTASNDITTSFASLAVSDLKSYLKDLFQFIDPNFPFDEDTRSSIKRSVEYLSDNFNEIADSLSRFAETKVGLRADGSQLSIEDIISKTIRKITLSSNTVVKYVEKQV